MVYLVAEHPNVDLGGVQRENVRTFARSVYDNFAKIEAGQEQARNIEAMFLGPDSWNDRGDERTLAGQMNEELAPHGLEFIKAKNDRAGGAQLIYTMLQNYQLKIAHTCTNTIEAIAPLLCGCEFPWPPPKSPLIDQHLVRIGFGTVHALIQCARRGRCT